MNSRPAAPAGRVEFILVEPTHPGNVGAAARAIRVMGFRRLVVVAPPDPDVLRHPQALAMASGADDVLATARRCDSLEAALADITLAMALSASGREFGPPPLPPRSACAELAAELGASARTRVALVFGTERTGLSIEQLQLCQRLCAIPGAHDYRSLNLAQAVQVMAFVMSEALAPEGGQWLSAPRRAPGTPEGEPATGAQVEAMYAHFERALVRIGFLDPEHPKKLMPRLRRLFSRTRLSVEEVDLLRGICTKIERSIGKDDK
jgi:tRNA/rRNA methyltransferase